MINWTACKFTKTSNVYVLSKFSVMLSIVINKLLFDEFLNCSPNVLTNNLYFSTSFLLFIIFFVDNNKDYV